MMTDQPSQQTAILRRALTDPGFRQRLKSDPRGALGEQGITVAEGVTIHVHEADERTAHIVLPALPEGTRAAELSDAELLVIAGGAGRSNPLDPRTCNRC